MRGRALILGVAALVAAACSSEEPPTVERADPVDPTVTTATTAPPAPATAPATVAPTSPRQGPGTSVPDPALPDRPPGGPIVDGVANGLVLVSDLDAGAESLLIVAVDGTVVTTLSRSDDEVVIQPVWSPDGRRIAWARSVDGVEWELAHAAVDGSDERSIVLPGRPDYLTFDPTASRVLALTPSPAGFGLFVVDLADEPTLRLADGGRPYFTDVAPDGTRVVAHAADRVRLVEIADAAAAPRPFDVRSTTHQTPQWHPTEDRVVYTVDRAESSAELIVRDLATDESATIAAFDGFVLFDLDPSGTRLAVSTIGASAAGGTPRAFRSQEDLPGLSVVDVAGGRTTVLADEPTAAPLWDPTGSLVLARDAIGDRGRWLVFDPDEPDDPPATTDTFSVGGTEMPLYLRFWDQYVRSQTVWAPDGSAFVHVGTADDGRSGVWIHDPASSGASAFLRAGDLAFWSPT